MQLNVNDDQHLNDPDVETILSALKDLEYDEFAILARADEQYIQTYYNDDGTYTLEYRAGSEDEHYGTDPEETTLKDVQDAFAAYFGGKPDWRNGFTWEKVEFD